MSVISFSHVQKWHRPTFLHHPCPWSCFYSYRGFLFQRAISFSPSSQRSKCGSWLSIPSANTDSYPISEINAAVSFIDQVKPEFDSLFLHLRSHPSPRSVTGLQNVPQNYNQSPSSQPSSLTSPFYSIVSYSNPLDVLPTSSQPLSGHITIREQKCFNVKQNTLWFHLVPNASYWSCSEIKAPSHGSQAIFSPLSPRRLMSLPITSSLRSNLRHFVFSCYCSFWSNVPVSFLSRNTCSVPSVWKVLAHCFLSLANAINKS